MTKGKKQSGKVTKQAIVPTQLKKREQRELRVEADAYQSDVEEIVASVPLAPNSKEIEPKITNATTSTGAGIIQSQPVTHEMARDAAKILGFAALIAVLMMLVAAFAPSGGQAIKGIGGVFTGPVPETTARMALALDTLFPVFYGAGIALFVVSLRTRANRPLIRIILTAMIIAILADFAENAFIFEALNGRELNEYQWPLTVIKYGSIAFSVVILSAIIVPAEIVSKIVFYLARYLFPVGIAALVAGLGGDTVRTIVGAFFPISLLILAQLAHNLGRS